MQLHNPIHRYTEGIVMEVLYGDWTQKCHREGAQRSGLMFE